MNRSSEYRMGWFLVLFDLPTDTKEERKVASRFRKELLNEGYFMVQYSVYARCAVTLDRKESISNNLRTIAPTTGNVHTIFITESQWKNSEVICSLPRNTLKRILPEDQVEDQLQFW